MATYIEIPVGRVVRFRVEPRPRGWVPQTDGWRSVHNGFNRLLRLEVTDQAISVRGFGAFGRLMEAFRPLKLKLSLPPRETTMSVVRLTDLGSWRTPRPKADFVALSCTLPNHSEYTLAVRPSDDDLDRLRHALKTAGVSEAE